MHGLGPSAGRSAVLVMAVEEETLEVSRRPRGRVASLPGPVLHHQIQINRLLRVIIITIRSAG